MAQQDEERITARNQCFFDAPAHAVFAVLSDANSYDRWVVGAKAVRDADASWPAVGSRLHHTVGAGPVGLEDSTSVLASDAPRHLRLRARGAPSASPTSTSSWLPNGAAFECSSGNGSPSPGSSPPSTRILDPLIRVPTSTGFWVTPDDGAPIWVQLVGARGRTPGTFRAGDVVDLTAAIRHLDGDPAALGLTGADAAQLAQAGLYLEAEHAVVVHPPRSG